ncbi:MAG: hypothetical protein JWQ54_29 [Mucilaginibacter sp.]|nr:hypothetical protein [Mucilaginibacter sp.]
MLSQSPNFFDKVHAGQYAFALLACAAYAKWEGELTKKRIRNFSGEKNTYINRYLTHISHNCFFYSQ